MNKEVVWQEAAGAATNAGASLAGIAEAAGVTVGEAFTLAGFGIANSTWSAVASAKAARDIYNVIPPVAGRIAAQAALVGWQTPAKAGEIAATTVQANSAGRSPSARAAAAGKAVGQLSQNLPSIVLLMQKPWRKLPRMLHWPQEVHRR